MYYLHLKCCSLKLLTMVTFSLSPALVWNINSLLKSDRNKNFNGVKLPEMKQQNYLWKRVGKKSAIAPPHLFFVRAVTATQITFDLCR